MIHQARMAIIASAIGVCANCLRKGHARPLVITVHRVAVLHQFERPGVVKLDVA